ncbi:MAG: FAD-binding oxidoreductase [Acidobacteria bacterium]|nr:FAD-binding oxidoreductase [Acidobacteriota bacterium]
MRTDNGESTSVWMATADTPREGRLAEDLDADVCVVGAGIAGMTTAYLLAREGKRVAVLDDGAIAGGETCRTTAHLVTALDDRYFELEKLFGERGAHLAAESHAAAIEKVEEIVGAEKIDCDFSRLDGYLFVPPGEATKVLDDELAAAHRCGLTEIEEVERVPDLSFDTGRALRFPRQAQFHILKYIDGLARALKRDGGRVFMETHAEKIEGVDDDAARVETSGGKVVTSRAVVVATNSPVNDLFEIHTKQAPYRTYVIGARVARGSVPKILLWDTPDPYHYIRIQEGSNGKSGYDVLVVGGEDHKTGQADDAERRFGILEKWTRDRFPMVEGIEFRWSGQVMEPVDSLAFIGRNPLDKKSVYIATGDSGNGMTHGTIAGILITDLIAGRENEWAAVYDPSRKTLSALPDFAKENLNVAAQYTDLATPGDVESVDEIKPGEGAILRAPATARATTARTGTSSTVPPSAV